MLAGYIEYGIGDLTIFTAFKNWEKFSNYLMQRAFTKTKILPKAEKTIFQYFLNKNLNSPKPRSYQKLKKSMFQYF